MRALDSVPDPNLGTLGENVVNRYPQIRKAGKVPIHTLLKALTAENPSVDGKLFREKLVYNRQAPPVEAFVDPTAYEGLVA
jgi:hypothetical protein